MKAWLFLLVIVLGLVAFAAIVWFGLPFLAFGGVAPFESEWVRFIIIAVVWLVVGLFYGIRFLLRRRAARKLEAGLLAAGENDTDAKVLSQRMAEALATLKASSGNSTQLYTLPWYIIIGPPGAGKTTALLNSGLKFPLAGADGGASVAGTGGTRYCDWWFTDEAVLIDTAGRYTTQDSDQGADKKSWLSFLSLLKKNRPKQPINGVIVAISLEDIVRLSPSELAEHSTAIRKRLIEVHQQLKIDFPVYALFTKSDLVAGFNEYFGNFTESRRRKVWGATFQTEDRRKNMISAVPGEFDALVKRLTEELSDRLQEEPDAMSRIAIFGFPAQFAMLRQNVIAFLGQIFEPNRYQVNANLRGFYFSSGTQEGTPIDQVLGAMDRSVGGQQGFRQYSGLGKSYFLHDLITKVIFSETGWVSMDRSAVRRSAFLRYGTMAVAGLATALLIGAWGWSYFNNDTLIANTDQFVANYRVNADDLLKATTVSDFDLEGVLPALDMLAKMPVGFEHRADAVPLGETFGLSQRERLVAAADATYRQALERMFRSRLILRLESRLQAVMNDPIAVYETLKVYMMLCGVADVVDDELIVDWMKHDWEQNLYAGPNSRGMREDLERHLRAMLALDVGRQPSFDPNGTLIQSAQATLTRLSVADQAYAYLKSLPPAVPLEDFSVAARSGPEAAAVFETVDGGDFGALMVPALFTYRGFHEHFLIEMSSIVDLLKQELWVRGELGREMITEEQFAQLGPQLLALYSKDFVLAWSAVLDNLKLKPLPGEKPDYITLSIVANPLTSPIRALVEAVTFETALTQEAPAPATDTALDGAAGDALALAAKAAQNKTTGLARIGLNLALQKSDLRPGDSASSQALIPGANVEAQFKDYAVLVEGQPRAIDALLESFNEIHRSLVIAALNPSQGQQAMASVQLNVANLSISASRFPAPLRRMISAAVTDLEGDAAGTSLAQLNQSLASNVTRLCEQLTANFYPFSPNSQRDLPMADFARMFAPNGVMDQFFAQNLAVLADLSGDVWVWKEDTALGRELSNTALREFQRAAQIRDAFFPPNSAAPSVSLTIGHLSLNAAADMALLDINGTIIQTQQVGSIPGTIQWPSSQGTGAVTLTILPELPGRESFVTIPGPWALMRLIERNTVSRDGAVLRVQIVLGGRDVSYTIQVGTVFNPFFLPALSEFSCPTGL